MIIGSIIGSVASIICTFLLFFSHSYRMEEYGMILTFLLPPTFLGVFTYFLLKRYPHIWGETQDRILCVCFSLIGYSIGWNIIVFLALIFGGKAPSSPWVLFNLFVDLIFTTFSIGIVPILGVPSVLATIIVAYFITKGLEIKHKILVTLLLILLVFWPTNLVLAWLAE